MVAVVDEVSEGDGELYAGKVVPAREEEEVTGRALSQKERATPKGPHKIWYMEWERLQIVFELTLLGLYNYLYEQYKYQKIMQYTADEMARLIDTLKNQTTSCPSICFFKSHRAHSTESRDSSSAKIARTASLNVEILYSIRAEC